MFKTFKVRVQNQLERKIKILRGVVSVLLIKWTKFLQLHGIIKHQVTSHYSPQSNKIEERKNIEL